MEETYLSPKETILLLVLMFIWMIGIASNENPDSCTDEEINKEEVKNNE